MNQVQELLKTNITADNANYNVNIFSKCFNFTAADELRNRNSYPFFQVIDSCQGPEVTVEGRRMLMLGSNSYLDLTTHPAVKRRAAEAVETYGSCCAGSRFLNGTLSLHVELEARLAAFVGKEAALIHSTGFQTNTGVLASLVQEGDFVLLDRYVHACIVDGCALAKGHVVRFGHNDMADLERKLAGLPEGAPKLIVTDGVFSMEGDLCDLPGIVALARRHGAQVMVDDAHGLGVFGPGGAGTSAHFGLTDEVDLIMGTFSKALGSIGGFIAGPAKVIDYLKHHSRSFIFSASPTPSSMAAVLAALDVMAEEPQRFDRLWANIDFMKRGLEARGFDTGASASPIIPVIAGQAEHCLGLWACLRAEGLFVNPVLPPAVPPNRCLLRVTVTAGHAESQLARALDGFVRARASWEAGMDS